jgi:signal transduction histidine kinase
LGIEEADLPYIFNPFFRSEHSRSKKNSVGDGIGLSIAKKITEVHGGSIRVESRIGKGATFIVKLPFINRRRYPR